MVDFERFEKNMMKIYPPCRNGKLPPQDVHEFPTFDFGIDL